MDFRRLMAAAALSAFSLLCLAGCATTPPVSAAPVESPPAPAPEAAVPAPAPPQDAQASQDQQDWNLFPDPTTGHVDVYYKGNYVGAVTGNEPAKEDPPLPHPVPHESPAIIP